MHDLQLSVFLQITLRAVIDCMEKSNKCFEMNPDAWRAVKRYGLQLLLLRELERYRDKFPDKENLQDKWKMAVTHPSKYVNLFGWTTQRQGSQGEEG